MVAGWAFWRWQGDAVTLWLDDMLTLADSKGFCLQIKLAKLWKRDLIFKSERSCVSGVQAVKTKLLISLARKTEIRRKHKFPFHLWSRLESERLKHNGKVKLPARQSVEFWNWLPPKLISSEFLSCRNPELMSSLRQYSWFTLPNSTCDHDSKARGIEIPDSSWEKVWCMPEKSSCQQHLKCYQVNLPACRQDRKRRKSQAVSKTIWWLPKLMTSQSDDFRIIKLITSRTDDFQNWCLRFGLRSPNLIISSGNRKN